METASRAGLPVLKVFKVCVGFDSHGHTLPLDNQKAIAAEEQYFGTFE